MMRLAISPTTFVGRTDEIDEITGLLKDPQCRLLTLVGPGGIGKTRLALEAVHQSQVLFPDGVFIISLAPLNQANDLLTAIAEATPFNFQQDSRDPSTQFFDYLREKQQKHMLLLLDNFEHLMGGVEILSEILAVTENLKILVTSREALNLQEEWVRPVTGMTYPVKTNGRSLYEFSAVQLFLDRARRIQPNFDPAEHEHSIIEICRLVDGMPLAIELAASWLSTLPPAVIADEIRQSMDILATRSRNMPERHRSIRSVFSHSWKLLSDEEREIFQKLSVFGGGFTREAAEKVAGASLHTLASLVDKSLVHLNTSGRYYLHELLRQYGAEQMEAANQTETTQLAYCAYFLNIVHTYEQDIKGHGQIAALDAIEADFENIRRAWLLAVQYRQFEILSRAVESLHFFADMRGRYHEVVALLGSAVEQLPHAQNDDEVFNLNRIQIRLVRLILLGNLRIDSDLSVKVDACLQMAHTRQDRAEIAYCLLVAGITIFWEGHQTNTNLSEKASAIFHESYTLFEEVGDLFYMADALAWMPTKDSTYNNDAISDLFWRSLELRKQLGDKNGIAWITLNLSMEMHSRSSDQEEAERYAHESLALMHEIRSLKGILQAQFNLAEVEIYRGNLENAAVLVHDMQELADETNNLDGKLMAASLQALLSIVLDDDYSNAVIYAEKAQHLAQETFMGSYKDPAEGTARAIVACYKGDYQTARAVYDRLFWTGYNEPIPASICLSLEAVACANEGAPEKAVQLLALAFHQPQWAGGWLQHWPLVNRLRADLAQRLGAEQYQELWERGASQNTETVIQSIVSTASKMPHTAANQTLQEPLSDRELEVLHLITEGLSNREIAERLFLSVGTIKVHIRNIYGKLHVGNRAQAIAQARKSNILSS